jgi:flagellar protein FlaI
MTDVVMVMARTEIDGRPTRKAGTAAEIRDVDPKTRNIRTNEIFKWNPKEDTFAFLGQSTILEEHMKKQGITQEDIRTELNARRTVLEWMVRKGIRRYIDVANVIREYYANPKRVFQKARVGLK